MIAIGRYYKKDYKDIYRILLILLFVLFAGLTCLLVYSIFCYFKDYMWIRKNLIEGRCMQRKELETILKNIHFNRQKYKYVDMLLLQLF